MNVAIRHARCFSVRAAGAAVFFLLVAIALIDVVAGYSVSVIAARREVAFKT